MALPRASRGRTADDFQKLLLNMEFNSPALLRQPKKARQGQLVDDSQVVAGTVLFSLAVVHITACCDVQPHPCHMIC